MVIKISYPITVSILITLKQITVLNVTIELSNVKSVLFHCIPRSCVPYK